MSPILLLTIYCVLILLASLAGGWLPMLIRLTHTRLELAISLIGGIMLGLALLEMLPHAYEQRVEWAATIPVESIDTSHAGEAEHAHDHEHDHAHEAASMLHPLMLWALGGFLAMFLIERFFCFHHHDPTTRTGEADAGDNAAHQHCDDPAHYHAHAAGRHEHSLTWTGAAIGLTLHSLLAGIALAAAVASTTTITGGARTANVAASWGIFLIILLHKPFDSMTIGTLMAAGGWSMKMRHVVNGLFALAIPAGVLLLYLGLGSDIVSRHWLLSSALAASAGMFLCIALSDLLPELQFHSHDRVKLSLALVIGLAIAWGITLLEGH